MPSDHFCILCNIDFPKPKCAKVNISIRKIEDIDHGRFVPDLENADFGSEGSTIDELVDKFNLCLNIILQIHAPIIHRTVRARPHAPWYNDSLRGIMRDVRKTERKCKSTPLHIDFEWFKQKRRDYKKALDQAKRKFYYGKCQQCDLKNLSS